MKKNINTISISLPHVYGFLFVFTSICRQFHFAGFLDLRYVTLFLGVVLVAKYLFTNHVKKVVVQKRNMYLFAYFLLGILSNISWFFNGININEEGFRKLVILNVFNICGVIVFSLYTNFFSKHQIWKWILFSCVVLVLSMFLAYIGIDMESIWGTGLKGTNIIDDSTNLTRNLLGEGIRAAGYAEDPNYATLFMVMGILAAVICCNSNLKFVNMFIFLYGIIIANSNTVIISLVFGLIISVIIMKIKRSDYFVYSCLFGMICIFIVLLPIIRPADSLLTLHSRYDMWNNAMILFLRNPLIGNGWSSFRCIHSWYVHCHSTYWEILSENGVIAFASYIIYCQKTAAILDDYKIKYLVTCYFIFCMMFDMSYMQISTVILFLLPEVYINEKRKSIVYD